MNGAYSLVYYYMLDVEPYPVAQTKEKSKKNKETEKNLNRPDWARLGLTHTYGLGTRAQAHGA